MKKKKQKIKTKKKERKIVHILNYSKKKGKAQEKMKKLINLLYSTCNGMHGNFVCIHLEKVKK